MPSNVVSVLPKLLDTLCYEKRIRMMTVVAMLRYVSLFVLLAALQTACTPVPEAVGDLPTRAELPSLTPSATFTITPSPSITLALPSATATRRPTLTATLTLTVTPSATITDTPSPIPTRTPTPTAESLGLGMLAQTALAVTVPPTLPRTAAPSPTFFVTPPGFAGTPLPGLPTLTGLPLSPVNCPLSPPVTLAQYIGADPALAGQLGCAVGIAQFVNGGAQVFQGGEMYFVATNPKYIYSFTVDGRFRRFVDTWVEGVDPNSGGETPPTGLIEPIRGFGKVWRLNPDVRAALGWAVTGELGGIITLQAFERGRAIYLPDRGETLVMVDNPDGQSGTWRAFSGGF